MKKTVSINIGGIVFHIEEDAYDNLKKYLAEINQYFSKYDDSKEIVSDIESRIAEVFLKKIKGQKQSINGDDVEEILKTMGSVTDFAMVDGDEIEEEEFSEERAEQGTQASYGQKKLFRDLNRKIMGGVCSGIANYLNIDPLWIRLLFLLLFFGFWFIPPASGFALIIYLILWAVTPGSADLEEDNTIKRLYRNPDERVIGGVASGLAAYFGTDTLVIRLLFVLSVLIFGFGVLLYIILWIITPEAITTTDKMRMRGEPVTLTNIETAVKKSFNVKPGEGESTFVRIVLFPFRILGQILDGLAKLLGPLLIFFVEAIRVLAGIFLVFIGLTGIAALFISLFFVMGVPMGQHVMVDGIPLALIENTITTASAIGVFLMSVVPAFASVLLGVRFLAKKPIYNAAFLWSLLGVWMVGLIMSAITVPQIAFGFAEEEKFEKTEMIQVPGPIIYLAVNEVEGMEDYEGVRLRIRPTDEKQMRLEYEFSATGPNEREAVENAKAIGYSWTWESDSIMVFDSNIKLSRDAVFRDQQLAMTLYMPIGQKFVLPEEILDIISNTIYHYGYDPYDDVDGNTFYFRNENSLDCIECDPGSGRYTGDNSKEILFDADIRSAKFLGAFKIIIKNDSSSTLKMVGDDEDISNIVVKSDDGELVITQEGSDEWPGRKRVTLYLSGSELRDLEIHGFNDLEIEDLERDEFALYMDGDNEGDLDFDVENLQLTLNGNSSLEIRGKGTELDAEVSGNSNLDAESFRVDIVNIVSSGNSKVHVYARRVLNAKESGQNEIIYSGNPDEINELD